MAEARRRTRIWSGADGVDQIVRRRFEIRGAVQGVGFRPFACRAALELGLAGFVRNTDSGVSVEAEGAESAVRALRERLRVGPPGARVVELLESELPLGTDPHGEAAPSFRILPSGPGGEGAGGGVEAGARALAPPDVATCPACLRELLDPSDRRHRHAFLACSDCGPRYSMLLGLPYDRERTSMRAFEPCANCRREYESPGDRRFHAEPIACPQCGPSLAWLEGGVPGLGAAVQSEEDRETDLVRRAARALRAGGLVAVKGIGGHHLLADAANESAVRRARELKAREARPFAVMFPSLEAVERVARVDAAERAALESPAAPIVLLRARAERAGEDARPTRIAPSVCGDSSEIGALLPYSPVHRLLLREFGGPVVATSLNRGEEPIVLDDGALRRDWLPHLAGALVHDRAIVRRAEDSVVRSIDGAPRALRLGRGTAPREFDAPRGIVGARGGAIREDFVGLALGAHQRNALALARGGRVVLGPHLGDLDSLAGRRAWRESVRDFLRLHGARPEVVVHDAHPDYFTTREAEEIAREFGARTMEVQHHRAHFLSAMLDRGEDAAGAGGHEAPARPVAALAWDGAGHGDDGTSWGGELLAWNNADRSIRRIGSLVPFALPGGEACVREPWRMAVALAAELEELDALEALERCFRDLEGAPSSTAVAAVARIARGARAGRGPISTGAGRLFDGVAATLGLVSRARYSGEPAARLEALAGDHPPAKIAPMAIVATPNPERGVESIPRLDWRPAFRAALRDRAAGAPPEEIAAAFHDALAEGAAALLLHAPARSSGRSGDGEADVYLTGGCFQNRRLSEGVARRLRAAGVRAILHSAIPSGDGGIAAGQALAAILREGRGAPVE